MADSPAETQPRPRPPGNSSRLSVVDGPRHPWVSPLGPVVDLPLALDLVGVDPILGEVQWHITATVDLVDDEPAVIHMEFAAERGLVLPMLQSEFRWATPLEVITRTVPQLLVAGIDPLEYDFPTEGYPDVADLEPPPRNVLTDAFLREVAQRYLALGRGYAQVIATERGVSPRTVVSWIEKARKRGLLTSAGRGAHGGEVVEPGS